jgi:hypothetical protein
MPNVSPLPGVEVLDRSFSKVALLGGVYNNHVALRTACQSAVANGCEAIFQMGDLGGFGPHPNKVFPLLEEFGVRCIQGNYEESLIQRLADCGCGYTHPKDNHYAALSYDYTDRNLSEENRALLGTFPKQLQFKLGTLTVHLCHGSPRRINEFLWETTTSNGFVKRIAADLRCHVLCCTHTGLPWTRQAAPDLQIVNVGALGRPANNGKQNVWYAELAWTGLTLDVRFIPVEYDWKALAMEMREEKLPAEFIETIETGWWTTCLEILPGKERMKGRF